MTTSHNQVDEDYTTLLQNDHQLQKACDVVKEYKKRVDDDTTLEDECGGSWKRRIVNVDDTSRISYEMIKNVPGNVPNHEKEYNGIDALKTKIYKQKLMKMNDQFHKLHNSKINENDRLHQLNFDENELPTDEEQIEILYKIQENLLQDYKKLLAEEKKWFLLKELIMDANIELDLYSQEEKQQLSHNNRKRKLRDDVAYKVKKINLGARRKQNANNISLSFNRIDSTEETK